MTDADGARSRGVEDDWNAHWDRFGDSATRNPAQLYRRRLILQRVPALGQRLLDIGSGQGDLAADVHRARPDIEVAGIELSDVGVESSRAKVPAGRFHQIDLLAGGDPVEGLAAWADVAVCSEVLEHLDDPLLFLENATPYLAAGCRLVVTVPGGPRSAYDRHIGHRRHFTCRALAQLLEGAGFRVEEVRAAGFPFFNLYKLMVVLRGRRVIQDAEKPAGDEPGVVRLVSQVFNLLFRLNLQTTSWGWQVVAVATAPPR